ncbi:MAG: hypothetical protein R2911_01435 [Caldilineaceae bacterium]
MILYAVGDAPENYGLQLGALLDTAQNPLAVYLTEAGQQLFPYLHPVNPLSVTDAPVYLAQPLDGAATPLLVTDDGQTVAALWRDNQGRQTLALTLAQHSELMHTLLLGYGLVNWVTRGLFLGERHVYLSGQIDDIFNANLLWDVATQAKVPRAIG